MGTLAAVNELIRQQLIAMANAQNAEYPQYKGHWDDWQVGTATREVKTKLGLACRKGQVVLFKEEEAPKHMSNFLGERQQVFYSVGNKCDTIVNVGTIVPMSDVEPARKAKSDCYVAIRKSTDCGLEWVNLSTTAALREEAQRKSDEYDKLMPEWAAANPLVRIARMNMTEE